MHCINEEFINKYMLMENNEESKCIKTGFNQIDTFCGGLQRGDVYLLASRPRMGKTLFAMNIWNHLLEDIEHFPRTVYISLDGSKEQCVKCLTQIRGVEFNMNRPSNKKEYEKYVEELNRISSAFSCIDDEPQMDIEAIYLSCKSIEAPIDLIIIDYLQLVDKTRTSLEMEKTLSDAKKIALEFNCPIVLLSQLPRQIELRIDHRPSLSDVDAMDLISKVDHVWTLYRDDYYYEDSDRKGIAEIQILKPISGVATFQFAWIPKFFRFVELEGI